MYVRFNQNWFRSVYLNELPFPLRTNIKFDKNALSGSRVNVGTVGQLMGAIWKGGILRRIFAYVISNDACSTEMVG